MVAMLGWFSEASTSASRVIRISRSRSWAKALGSTFNATSRFNRVSLARYTSPIPPTPSTETIVYGPMLVPAAKAMDSDSIPDRYNDDGRGDLHDQAYCWRSPRVFLRLLQLFLAIQH